MTTEPHRPSTRRSRVRSSLKRSNGHLRLDVAKGYISLAHTDDDVAATLEAFQNVAKAVCEPSSMAGAT